MTQQNELIIVATAEDGWTVRTGPVDLAHAITIFEEHMRPAGWNMKTLWLTPLDDAINVFRAGRNRHPRPLPQETDLFIALRRAIVCDREFDGAECPRVRTLLAHLQPHRPLQLWTGDEECRLSECACDGADDGICPTLQPAGMLCRHCSALHETGGEWGPDWLEACRVTWPCPVLLTVANHYKIPMPGELVR